MRSNRVKKRFSKPVIATLMIAIGLGYGQAAMAEISTLFTTPQERQIIDANRYKNDAAEQNRRPVEEPDALVISDLVREEVSNTYIISGIAISSEGFHSAWINDQEYMDGEIIEGNIKLKIIAGTEVKLRMTTPDGKRYYGTSGETLEVTYLTNTRN